MTVKELIKALLKLDQDKEVVVTHEEYADFDDSCGFTVVREVDDAYISKMCNLNWRTASNKEVVVLNAS